MPMEAKVHWRLCPVEMLPDFALAGQRDLVSLEVIWSAFYIH